MKGKRGLDSSTFFIGLILALIVLAVVALFYTGGFGTATNVLTAGDAVAKTAAAWCSDSMAVGNDEYKNFCDSWQSIEVGSILKTKQFVSCYYLHNSIRVGISGVEKYKDVVCQPTLDFMRKCQTVLKEHYDDSKYSILVNGEVCSQGAYPYLKDMPTSSIEACSKYTLNSAEMKACGDPKAEQVLIDNFNQACNVASINVNAASSGVKATSGTNPCVSTQKELIDHEKIGASTYYCCNPA